MNTDMRLLPTLAFLLGIGGTTASAASFTITLTGQSMIRSVSASPGQAPCRLFRNC